MGSTVHSSGRGSGRVVVIGAGAAGLMAGIQAAREGAEVTILESMSHLGAKILVSGGGRCNVTNEDMRAVWFNSASPPFVETALAGFDLDDSLWFFNDLGVPLKVEPEMGKLFPVSDSARTVLNALIAAVDGSGAELLKESPVTSLERGADGWRVTTPHDVYEAEAVILCTGGLALPKSGSTGAGYAFASQLGHRVNRTAPALSPLLADPAVHADLSGVTLPVRLELRRGSISLARYTGSFLFTHGGYSGPAALNLSRHVALAEPGAGVYVRFVPEVEDGDEAKFQDWLLETRGRQGLSAALASLVPRRVAQMITEVAGAPGHAPLGRLSGSERKTLFTSLLDQRLPVSGVAGYPKAEATAGGVCLDEVDAETMMSRLAPGFFLAGEILDVDGCLGGYNFQWAWTTGALAGRAAARFARQPAA
ncbi:MAG TPA: aminoacetone oxidase family FAD-binding enzyme [Armatimonadota bacterium]|jgi:hypothetical protein